ncbi:MAG: flagellar basal body-associated protein FliL [Halanaerobiaceae bacterium]|nr:flagellar basal body-associated protein FliL [Halanaerobiaceae bacterium]
MADGNNNGLSLKVIALMMIAMIIITGIFSYLFMSFFASRNDSENTGSKIVGDIGPTYSLGEFIVNLAGSHGYQYIQASIVVEVSEEKVIKELDKRSPQIRDTIILTLREQKIEDIEDPGADVIKNQLMTRLNLLLNTGEITNVWFTQLVVQ